VVIVVGKGDTVRKEARTAQERARLEREGRVLAFARHPGVVELLAAEPEALILRRVDGGSLADSASAASAARSEHEVAALGSAIATVLADLHDIGVAHGRVAASHVLLEPDGRPVLCGLGHGRCPGMPDGPDPADDVADLGAMLASLVAPGTSGALSRALVHTGHARPSRRPTARDLSRTLAGVAAGAPLPGAIRRRVAARPRPPDRARKRFLETGHGELVAAAAVAVAVVGLTLAASRTRARATAPHQTPVVVSGGVVVTANGRYRVGGPGDEVVLGRWRCIVGAGALAAVLRTSTGAVWVFDGWATPARALDPRLVARVPGATALRAARVAPGCDRLVVVRRSEPPITLAI
jgi:hypothetical protein